MNKNQKATQQKTSKGIGVLIDYGKQGHIPRKLISTGNTSDKIEVVLSDGKSRIYCKSQEEVPERTEFWESIINRKIK